MTEEDFETVLEAEHQRIDEARRHYLFTIAMPIGMCLAPIARANIPKVVPGPRP